MLIRGESLGLKAKGLLGAMAKGLGQAAPGRMAPRS